MAKSREQTLAGKLDALQKVKNNGRGVGFVRTIIAFLKRGNVNAAKAVCRNEFDKLSSYDDIKLFLLTELFCSNKFPWEIPRLIRVDQSYKRRKRASGHCLRAFFEISKIWNLNIKEEMRLLGIKSFQELGKRRRAEIVLPSNELEQLGWIFSILESLYILFPNSDEARNGWMKRKPNSAEIFGGKSAMEYIMESDLPMERILTVRNYLRSQLNGDFS